MLNLFLFSGIHIINLRKTWEKLVLAARIIAGIENPEDVCVISSRPYGTVCFYKYFALLFLSSSFSTTSFLKQIIISNVSSFILFLHDRALLVHKHV